VDLGFLSDRLGDAAAAGAVGLLIGGLFGAAAQRSRFCLRAATIEAGRREPGERLAVWLVSFATALVGTQVLLSLGALDGASIRALNTRGSLSGAILGGAIFGVGMVLARGCPSRLLVLTGQGNPRSLLSGLVFAVAAQASIVGILSPLRNTAASLWTIEGASLDLAASTGLGRPIGFVLALLWAVPAVVLVWRRQIDSVRVAAATVAGLAIIGGWWLTYSLSLASFDPLPVKSVTFSGPSAHALMVFLGPPERLIDFDTGLIAGVFAGSFLAAYLGGELKLEGFEGGLSMRRYLFGAVLMGFGAMLAGGCAVGSVSNSVVLATTGWVALVSMWAAAMLADRLFDRQPSPNARSVARA
jgi:uncharacterized membrane protein YedE/YeeE